MRKRKFGSSSSFTVTAHLKRRGPEGSLAVYEVVTHSPFTRTFGTNDEALSDIDASEVAQNILTQIAAELYPLLYRAIRSAQGDGRGPPATSA